MSYIKQHYDHQIAAGQYGTAVDAQHEHKWIAVATPAPGLFNVECADCHQSEGGDMHEDEANATARYLNRQFKPF